MPALSKVPTRVAAERTIVGAFVLEMLAYTSTTPGSQQLLSGIGALYRDQVSKIRSRGDFIAVLYRQEGRRMATTFAEGLSHLADRHAAVLLRAPGDLPVIAPILSRVMRLYAAKRGARPRIGVVT
jgi:hypothetical protein